MSHLWLSPLTANPTTPHSLADFVSRSSEQIQQLFVQVLLICDAEGLIGREMFAIDGCKLPGNASKEWSGTRTELKKKKRKLDRAARYILNKHRTSDQQEQDSDIQEREEQQRKKLRCASRKIQRFLDSHEERIGISGKPIKSNITDPDSAKMKTSHGVIQG